MLTILEFLAFSALSFTSFYLLLIPAGSLLLERIGVESRAEQMVLGPGLIAFLLGMLLLPAFFFPPWAVFAGHAIRLLLVAALGVWIFRPVVGKCYSYAHLQGALLWFASYLFCLSFVVFSAPDRLRLSPQDVQNVFELTADNLIPYNVSRYVVEGISPAQLPVLPTWTFTDRGPLAGLVVAALYLLFGIAESGHWLSGSPGIYLLYQSLMVFLNTLPVVLVWLIAKKHFGSSKAVLAVLLLVCSYFFVLNVDFTWPKFFSAYLFLAGLYLLSENRKFLSSMFVAASLLTHEVGFLYLALLLLGAIFGLYPALGSLRQILRYCVGVVLAYFPWTLTKYWFGGQNSRLIYLNALCLKDESAASLSMGTAVAKYLQENTLLELLALRLGNLFYPFNLGALVLPADAAWFTPSTLFRSMAHLSEYQLIFATGPVLLSLSLLGCILAFKSRNNILLGYLFCSLGAILPTVVLLGCPQSSWNHQWAYLAFSTLPLAALIVLQRWPKFVAISLLIHFALQIKIFLVRTFELAPGGVQTREFFPELLAFCLLLFAFWLPKLRLDEFATQFAKRKLLRLGLGLLCVLSFTLFLRSFMLPASSVALELRFVGNQEQAFWNVFPQADSSILPLVRTWRIFWGSRTSLPLQSDYDGDGSVDIGVFDPEFGFWRLLYRRGGFHQAKALYAEPGFGAQIQFGLPTDMPFALDLDQDGCADLNLLRIEDEAIAWLWKSLPCRGGEGSEGTYRLPVLDGIEDFS